MPVVTLYTKPDCSLCETAAVCPARPLPHACTDYRPEDFPVVRGY